MAKVTTGPIISDIRNKLGDVVFFRNRGGLAARAYADTPWTGTPLQVVYTDAFGDIMGFYQTALTDNQRRAWESFAQQFPNHTSINGTKPLTPAQAYIRTNYPLWKYAGLRLDDPPLNMDVLQPRSCTIVTNYSELLDADDFNRADAPNLGAGWTENPNPSFQIFSNSCAPNSAGGYCFAVHPAVTFGPDHISRVTLTALATTANFVGPAARVDIATRTGYGLTIFPTVIYLRIIVNAAQVGYYQWDHAPTVGRTYSVEAVGNQITVCEDGIAIIGPLTNNTIPTGQPGLFSHNAGTTNLVDDYYASKMPVGPSLTVTIDPPPTANEVLILALTPPLPAARLQFVKCWLLVPAPTYGGVVNLAILPGPVALPHDIYAAWKAFYDARVPAVGTLVTGKRIGLLAYFMNLTNGALSQKVIHTSLTT
jgi:hypothetical protein